MFSSDNEELKKYDKPSYLPQSMDSGCTAGLFDYVFHVVDIQEHLNKPVVGITELGDCIGIIGWHQKATLFYHMKNVEDLSQLYCGLLSLVKKINKISEDLLKETDNFIDYLKHSDNDQKNNQIVFEKKMQQLSAFVNQKIFQDIKFTLVTKYPRQMNQLLFFFAKTSIEKNQIKIDSTQDSKEEFAQVFVERATGKISDSCKNFPLNKDKSPKAYLDKDNLRSALLLPEKNPDFSRLQFSLDFNEVLKKDSPDLETIFLFASLLIKNEVNVNEHLLEAISDGNFKIVQCLVQAKANIHFADKEMKKLQQRTSKVLCSPLIEAIKSGNKEIVLFILKNKIDLEKQFSPFHFNSALTTAIKYDKKDIAQLILDQKPLPTIEWLDHRNTDDMTAFEMAQKKGWTDICEKIEIIKEMHSSNNHKSIFTPLSRTVEKMKESDQTVSTLKSGSRF